MRRPGKPQARASRSAGAGCASRRHAPPRAPGLAYSAHRPGASSESPVGLVLLEQLLQALLLVALRGARLRRRSARARPRSAPEETPVPASSSTAPARAAACAAEARAQQHELAVAGLDEGQHGASLSPAARRSRTSTRRSRASSALQSSIDWFWHTRQRSSWREVAGAGLERGVLQHLAGLDGVGGGAERSQARMSSEQRSTPAP